MNARERVAFNREVYGPEGRSQKETEERSQAANAARTLATAMRLPQRVIDRAASYGADGGDPIEAVRRAAEADGIQV